MSSFYTSTPSPISTMEPPPPQTKHQPYVPLRGASFVAGLRVGGSCKVSLVVSRFASPIPTCTSLPSRQPCDGEFSLPRFVISLALCIYTYVYPRITSSAEVLLPSGLFLARLCQSHCLYQARSNGTVALHRTSIVTLRASYLTPRLFVIYASPPCSSCLAFPRPYLAARLGRTFAASPPITDPVYTDRTPGPRTV